MSSRLARTDPLRAASGISSSDISSEMSSMRSQMPETGPFSRAVVFDVLGDLSRRTEDELKELSKTVQGGMQVLLRAPRNSLLVRTISGAGSRVVTTLVLCYPFFPPHFGMPVKPGEQVWIMMETQSSSYGYWISRVTEHNFVDDVNFTHSDRRFDLYVDKVKTDTASSIVGDDGNEPNPFDGLKTVDKTPGPPKFNNGPTHDRDALPTLRNSDENDTNTNVFDQIYTGSFAMQTVVLEPVPRFTKRPGDFVIQGSNNTLICLGQDRGWNKSLRPDSVSNSNAFVDVTATGAATTPLSDFCGTIDIVSGRGRFYSKSAPNPDNAQIKDTQPRVILNSRNKLEIDKNPAVFTKDAQRKSIASNRVDRPQEGDPDFLTDASRIYVSMRTSGDVNFSIPAETISPPFEGEVKNISDSPFIVMKSDEIRIIARKELDRDSINGSIRIIKEGTIGEDAASVYLMPTGVVQITGSKIYLGQANQGSGPGEAGSEPYVKYSALEALLTKTFDNIDQFCQKLLTHTTPGYGAPSIQILQASTEFKTQVLQRKQEIENLKSLRVFGE